MSTIISGGGSLAAHLDDFYEVLLLAPQKGIFQYPSKTVASGSSQGCWSRSSLCMIPRCFHVHIAHASHALCSRSQWTWEPLIYTQVLSLPVLNGWGLTETSPVLACRRSVPPRENVRGLVGLPIPGTQVRVVDPETLAPLAEGERVRCLASRPLPPWRKPVLQGPSPQCPSLIAL